jgi:hypothetical protein
MTQLTIRGFDKALDREIRALSKREGISLNHAVLKLLRKGAGLETSQENEKVIGHSYDDLIGTWSKQEALAFDKAVACFDMIDEDMWK